MAKLAEAGISLRLGDDGRVYAGPASQLTPGLRRIITEHKDGIVLELSPPRERDLRLRIAELERELARERTYRQMYEGLSTAFMAENRLAKAPPVIPPDIRRALTSCCHPDRASNPQAAQTAMAWINTQPRG